MDKKTQAYICSGCGIGEGIKLDPPVQTSNMLSVTCITPPTLGFTGGGNGVDISILKSNQIIKYFILPIRNV